MASRKEEASRKIRQHFHTSNPAGLGDMTREQTLAMMENDPAGINAAVEAKIRAGIDPFELPKLLFEGQDRKKVRTPKMSARKQAHFNELVANVPDSFRMPGRSLEELIKTDDAITPAESMTMLQYYSEGAISAENASNPLSEVFLLGAATDFAKYFIARFFSLEKEIDEKFGPLEKNDIPYGKRKQEAARIIAKEFGEYHDGRNRSTVFEMLVKGILFRGGDPELAFIDKAAVGMASLLITHGTPVDAVDIMGNTALMYTMGCSNSNMTVSIDFAEWLIKGGANVNHRNRQGQCVLGLASASTVTHGEDAKRGPAVKWLLEHGGNPDLPDHQGFTPRMNGQYSKVITKIYREEDRRRESLPTHCRFCIYVPPEEFEPGLVPVAGGKFLLKEKEPPRKMLMCSQCHAAAYCRKECQRADWRHHKKICKAAKPKPKSK